MRQPGPVGGHAVYALDRPDGDHVLIGPRIAHHPDAFDRQQNGKGLPHLVVEIRRPDFLIDDGVGPAQQRQLRFLDRPEDTNGQARAGKRLAADDLLGQPQHPPQHPNLILEQLAQGLDQGQAHALGQAADVVVAFDGGRRTLERHRLDHIRVQRALGQEVGP